MNFPLAAPPPTSRWFLPGAPAGRRPRAPCSDDERRRQRRAHLLATTCFLVLGHGSWDQLRAPFFGLCAKGAYRVVERDWLALPASGALAETDAWLAAHFRAGFASLSPRLLSPLPLLGIPGVTADADCAGYYRDVRQFRPPPHTRGA